MFRKKRQYTDEELTAMIRQGPGSDGHREAMTYLYDKLEKKAIRSLLKKNRLSADAAQDICRHALLELLENIRLGKYRGTGSIEAYFWRTLNNMKNDWFKRKEDPAEIPELSADDKQRPDFQMLENEKYEILDKLLAQLPEKCRELMLWDKTECSLQALADRLAFASLDVLYVTRLRCWEKFENLRKEQGNL